MFGQASRSSVGTIGPCSSKRVRGLSARAAVRRRGAADRDIGCEAQSCSWRAPASAPGAPSCRAADRCARSADGVGALGRAAGPARER